MLQIYQIITIWKYLNKLFLFTSQKRQNKRGHFKASFYSSPLFYPIAPTKPIVQLIRAYFTPISSMQNNQCEVLYPNCEPTSHFSPSFQSKMRSKWEALWFFVFLPVLLYLLYINIIRVIGFTFRISSYISSIRTISFYGVFQVTKSISTTKTHFILAKRFKRVIKINTKTRFVRIYFIDLHHY